MSNIEKIRQEIKRRHDYENEMYHKTKPDGRPNNGWAESLAIIGVLEELLAFINSLPEETCKDSLQIPETCKENPESFTSELDAEIEMQWDSFNKHLAEYGEESEEVVWLNWNNFNEVVKEALIAGAKWQANQLFKDSPLPEDTVLFQKGVEEGRRLEREERKENKRKEDEKNDVTFVCGIEWRC